MSVWQALLFAAVQPSAVAVAAPAPDQLSFSIRADPSVAERVNKVLSEVGRPVRTRMPANAFPAQSISHRCRDFAHPEIIAREADRDPNWVVVVHKPCLSFRQNRDFVVKPGYTIDSLAMAAGLRPSSSDGALVQKQGSDQWVQAHPKLLSVGDKVRFLNVPSWTSVQVDAAQIGDRSALIARIGNELGCPPSEVEICVQKRGIDVADDNAPKSVPHRVSPTFAPEPPAQQPSPQRIPERGIAAALAVIVAPMAAAIAAQDSDPALAPPAPDAPSPSIQPVPEDARSTAPVAEDQWPYDRARVAALLSTDKDRAREAVIGVADAGLGDAEGLPLPRWIFSRNPREEDPEPDGNDDDGNEYVDDMSGAGVARNATDLGSGDLGACPPPGVASTLTGERRERADHGAIVASIVSGLDIHRPAPISVGLPRLVFFRFIDNLCGDEARLYATEADFLRAMEYVYERAPTLVISYTFSSELTSGFQPTAKNYLENLDKLLILPAGNDGPGNLDDDPRCPACLAATRNGIVATRTLVVGTGLRDLTIAPFSNWGREMVRLYAPGETSRAVDIQGLSASYPPATSWSAPHAALAVGIMQSLGLTNVRDVRERLIGSAWPIIDSAGKADPNNAGILNITAAASVRHTAIEVIEKNEQGAWVRRTYVGQLDTPKAELCDEASLGPVHSVRFGPLEGSRRKLTMRSFTWDSQLGKFPVKTNVCTLPGQIRFTDLLRGSMSFDSSSVTQILFPWPL